MREKIGAFIQFLAVIVAAVMLMLGLGSSYMDYFAAEIINVATLTLHLIIAAVGAGVGIVGVIVGNLLKR